MKFPIPTSKNDFIHFRVYFRKNKKNKMKTKLNHFLKG